MSCPPSVRRTFPCLTFSAMLAAACLPPPVSAAAQGAELRRGARIALVVADDTQPRARMAVDDLASFLQRSLGAVVRRYPAGGAVLSRIEEDACLVFGPGEGNPAASRLAGEAGVALATGDLGTEGSLVRSASIAGKPVVFLTGKTLAGACHAAYSFLERELGIGFFIDGNRVPELAAVGLAGLDRRESPAVPIRGIFYHPTWKHPHATSWRL